MSAFVFVPDMGFIIANTFFFDTLIKAVIRYFILVQK